MISPKNKICFASIDVEPGVESLDKILRIFEKHGVKATLFVTGQVLEKYQDRARGWGKSYEIACHTFTHRFWNTISRPEREKELCDFLSLYYDIFQTKPKGFRAPSHIIDQEALKLLDEKGFIYDSSVVPHYPPFKKYRGYKGRKPLMPYHPKSLKILEIPVAGQFLGIPLAGAWLSKLPFWIYGILFFFHCPSFIALSIHSWDKLKNLEKIIKLLKGRGYQFLNGEQIFQNYRQK